VCLTPSRPIAYSRRAPYVICASIAPRSATVSAGAAGAETHILEIRSLMQKRIAADGVTALVFAPGGLADRTI